MQDDTQTHRSTKEEPAKSRRHSFDSVCGKCGALLPAGSNACLVCRSPREAVPYRGEFPVKEQAAPSAYPRRTANGSARKTPEIWQRWGMGVSLAILLLCLGLGGINIYLKNFDTSSYRAAESILYETQNRLMLSHPGLSQPVEVEGVHVPAADFLDGTLQHSPNGRFVVYTTPGGNLYLLDLARQSVGTAPGESLSAVLLGERIFQPVFFSKNSRYLLYLNERGELHASDFSESWKLDTGVAEMLGVGSRRVLYTRRGDNPNQLDLYLHELSQNSSEWQVVDRDIREVLDWTDGFEKLIYTCVRQQEDGSNVTNLQLFQFSKESPTATVLAEDIGKVLDVSAQNGTAIYLSPPGDPWQYEDFIQDDLAFADAALLEPDLAEFPLVEEAFLRYGEDVDILRWAVSEDLVEEYHRYIGVLDELEKKEQRDALRQQLQARFNSLDNQLSICDLYVYRDGAPVLLESNVIDDETLTPEAGRVSAALGYVTYQWTDPTSLRRTKMSQLWENDDAADMELPAYYLRNAYRELRFAPYGGSSARVYPRTETMVYRDWRVAPDASGIYFTVGQLHQPEELTSLYYAPLKNGVPGNVERVAQKVAGIGEAFRTGVFFFTQSDPASETATLLYAQGGKAQTVVTEGARLGQPLAENTALLYLDNMDPQQTGELYLFTKDSQHIATGVSGSYYLSNERIYLLRPGKDTGNSDIYLWSAGKETPVAKDVSAVLGVPALQPKA